MSQLHIHNGAHAQKTVQSSILLQPAQHAQDLAIAMGQRVLYMYKSLQYVCTCIDLQYMYMHILVYVLCDLGVVLGEVGLYWSVMNPCIWSLLYSSRTCRSTYQVKVKSVCGCLVLPGFLFECGWDCSVLI